MPERQSPEREKTMKRMMLILLALLMLLSLTACGGSSSPQDQNANAEAQAAAAETAAEEEVLPEAESEAETAPEPAEPEGNVFRISSAEDLLEFNRIVVESNNNQDAILLNDIDLSSVCGPDIGSWNPIGSYVYEDGTKKTIPAYGGVFDGNGHTISGMYCEREDNNGGLFYEIEYGEVRDLTITDSRVYCEGKNTPAYHGILSGYMERGGTVSNVTVTDSCVVEVPNGVCLGGLIGEVRRDVTIENCSSACTVIGNGNLGGICGSIEEGVVISGCVNTGEITGEKLVGGIVGEMEWSVNLGFSDHPCLVIGCVNYGSITAAVNESGRYLGGGVIGCNSNCEALFCVNAGEVFAPYGTIDCYFGDYDDLGRGKNLQIGPKGERDVSTTRAYEPGDPALTNGEALAALGEEYWTQGETFPVWNGTMPE